MTVAPAETAAAVSDYTVQITSDPALVAAACRLRYRVFAGELGALLGSPPAHADTDEFDELCEHLVVLHRPTGEVVGTYRLLPPGRSARLYADSEFHTGGLDPVRPWLIEAGRSCVHPEHRSGAVITLMWSALARYVLDSGQRYLAGCASVPLRDGGVAAAHTRALARRHPAPRGFGVVPRNPWRGEPAQRPSYAKLPPLVRGYLRLGAAVCGPPCHDRAFGVADFFVLLRLDRADPRYLRYLLGSSATAGRA